MNYERLLKINEFKFNKKLKEILESNKILVEKIKILKEKNEMNLKNSINIKIVDNYLCEINYSLEKNNIKDFGFLVKIPFLKSGGLLKGILSKFRLKEEILNEITNINVINYEKNLNFSNENKNFIFSDYFLGVTFIEIKNENLDFIEISKEIYLKENPILIKYSQNNQSFEFIEGKIENKWGVNIIYKEDNSNLFNEKFYNLGMLYNNKLIGIHNENSYKNSNEKNENFVVNLQIISLAIELSFFSKIKNLNNKKINSNDLNEIQIKELNKIGLQLTEKKNLLISPASFMVTPIWFFRTPHAWYWTPTEPEKSYSNLKNLNWMIVFPDNSLKVIGGFWDGIEPAKKNINIIHWLEKNGSKFI